MKEAQRAADALLTLRCQSGEEGAWPQLLRSLDEPLRYYAAREVVSLPASSSCFASGREIE